MTAPRGLVVVGLDASGSARNAARWAAVEAADRRAELRVVHARSAGSMDRDDGRSVDDGLLNATIGELRERHHRLDITVHLDDRHPATALREESRSAGLTVVGSWTSSSAPGVPLGSIALAVASNNPAPVAVIHPRDHPNTQGCVVLALDGSATGEDAVGFAFQAADLRCADLVVVHVWRDTDPERAPLPPFAGATQVRTAKSSSNCPSGSRRGVPGTRGYERSRWRPVDRRSRPCCPSPTAHS